MALKKTVWRLHSRTDFRHQRQPIRAEHRLGFRYRFTIRNFRTQLNVQPDENLVLLFLLISFLNPHQVLADFEH